MVFEYNTSERPLMFKISVKTNAKVPIRLIVKDKFRANTTYMNRYNTVSGKEDFIIRMPQSPQTALIKMFNEKTKNDDGFIVTQKLILPLKTQMSTFDFTNPKIKEFILFAQNFCDQAGYLSTGDYVSKGTAMFHIIYDKIIKSVQTGTELNTPARINSSTGDIQISQRIFTQYTVPGRFAILCHEFSHVYANKDIKDEIEADFHAATIYLGLGYPRIEILNVFANVFMKAETDLNKMRYEKIKSFIMNFDSNVLAVKY